MINKLFFKPTEKHEHLLGIKDIVNPTNEEIAALVKGIYLTDKSQNGSTPDLSLREAKRRGNLIITDDPIERNKRHVSVNNQLLGYVYIVHEGIPWPHCSDVNYLLAADTGYRIKEFIHLREMIEANQVVPVEKFEQFSDQFIGLSLLTDDYLTIKLSCWFRFETWIETFRAYFKYAPTL